MGYGKEIMFLSGLMLGLIITLICVISISKSSYKMGQIDCYNGKMNYTIVDQPDGTTKWEAK